MGDKTDDSKPWYSHVGVWVFGIFTVVAGGITTVIVQGWLGVSADAPPRRMSPAEHVLQCQEDHDVAATQNAEEVVRKSCVWPPPPGTDDGYGEVQIDFFATPDEPMASAMASVWSFTSSCARIRVEWQGIRQGVVSVIYDEEYGLGQVLNVEGASAPPPVYPGGDFFPDGNELFIVTSGDIRPQTVDCASRDL